MADNNNNNPSEIFSNITVKQSMSSFTGSPKADRSINKRDLGRLQSQILGDAKNNKSSTQIYPNMGTYYNQSTSEKKRSGVLPPATAEAAAASFAVKANMTTSMIHMADRKRNPNFPFTSSVTASNQSKEQLVN